MEIRTPNLTLNRAKERKDDEFYTQWADIEREVRAYFEHNPDVFRDKTIILPCDDPTRSNFTKFFAAHFRKLGLKKLISTGYSVEGCRGKIFVMDMNTDSLKWRFLEGDGDFRSDEIKALRDESDIVVTNPPFSLFLEFFLWIMEADKQFLILGNILAAAYREVFPFIKDNKVRLGAGRVGSIVYLRPDNTFKSLGNTCWFTNLEHGQSRRPLVLRTMEDNLRYNKNLSCSLEYTKYDNYDAIDIPTIDAIPSDYDGLMGVPISFLDKYCSEQFELVGVCGTPDTYPLRTRLYTMEECRRAYFEQFGKEGCSTLNYDGVVLKDGKLKKMYRRILIRAKR